MTLATFAFLLLASAPLARAVDVDNQACATSATLSADFFPESRRVSPGADAVGSADAFVDVGRLFDVRYSRAFKVVRTKPAADKDGNTRAYVLYQCGTPPPTTYDDGTPLPANAQFFSVPVRGVATVLTTVIGVLEQLGLRDKLKLVDPSNVHAPCVQALEESNNITSSHYFYDSTTWEANYTYWRGAMDNMTSSIDAVVTDGWLYGYSNSSKDVYFDNTVTGLSQLERTEMMKLLAMFFNKEAEASAYYADQVERWTYMNSTIAAAQSRGGLPTGYTCGWVAGGFGYTIAFDNFKKDLCEAAGLKMWVPAAAPAGASTYTYSDRAAFLADMVNVNVVIDETYVKSPSAYNKTAAYAALGFDTVSNLPSTNPRTGLFLRVDKHTSDGDTGYAHPDNYSPSEGLTWFEDQMVHPALVLQDLIRLSWLNRFITPLQAGCPRFFRDMNNDDTVIKTTAEDCPTWDRARAENLCLAQLSSQRTTVASLLGTSSATVGARFVASCVLAVIVSMAMA